MNNIKKLGLCFLLVNLAVSGLGCTSFTSATTTAVKVVSTADRRTTGTQIDDRNLLVRIFNDIKKRYPKLTHVNVNVYDGRVLLTGEVESEEIKEEITQLVTRADGVRLVNNEVIKGWPTSAFSRSNDSLITTKVKASFIDDKELSANAFIVATERSVVYLMGKVTPREARRAAELASKVSGVQRVVTIFDVISEQDLSRISDNSSRVSKSVEPAPVEQRR